MHAPVEFVVYADHKSPVPEKQAEAWPDFTGNFTQVDYTPCNPCIGHECPSKHGIAWSPVVLHETCQEQRPNRCTDERHKAGDKHHPATRLNVNVLWMTAAVLDLDGMTDAQVQHLETVLVGRRYVLHTTHSHTEANPRLRVILALSRPVRADEWAVVLANLVLALGVPADPTCKDLSRLYFLPSVAEGGAFLSEVGEGEPVDVDALLARDVDALIGRSVPSQSIGQNATKQSVSSENTSSSRAPSDPLPVVSNTVVNGAAPRSQSDGVDLGTLRACLAELRAKYKREKSQGQYDLIDNALNGRELVPQGQGQDTALHTVACMIGKKLPAGTPSTAALEIVRRSIVAMGAGPEGLEHWFDKFARHYERAHEAKIAEDLELAEKNKRLHGKIERLVLSRQPKGSTSNAVNQGRSEENDPSSAPPAQGGSDAPEGEDWRDLILWKPLTKADVENNRDPTWESNEHNAAIILERSEPWEGKLRFNEVTLEVECVGEVPITDKSRHPDVLGRAVANWLQIQKVNLAVQSVESTLLLVARNHSYNPVREYLTEQAARWDGVARKDFLLERYCGAPTVTSDGRDITEHLRRVGGKWLVSAAARGLKPGCKVDTVLILEGPQGGGKSSFFQVLGGKHYAVVQTDMTGKDGLLVLGSNWILELAELSALRKTDGEESKSFFTVTHDKFRVPYGRAPTVVPRPSVFGGSYNPVVGQEPGSDRSGNRRYWFVKVGKVDIAALRRDRDQLFAEAAVCALAGFAEIEEGRTPEEMTPAHRWWLLDGAEAEAAEAEALERMPQDSIKDAILSKWDAKPKTGALCRPVEFTIHDAGSWLGYTSGPLKKQEEIRIGHALKDLGFEHLRARRPDGSRPWVYRSTESQRARPVRSEGTPQAIAAVIAAHQAGHTS